jgi:hypothetical protein
MSLPFTVIVDCPTLSKHHVRIAKEHPIRQQLSKQATLSRKRTGCAHARILAASVREKLRTTAQHSKKQRSEIISCYLLYLLYM